MVIIWTLVRKFDVPDVTDTHCEYVKLWKSEMANMMIVSFINFFILFVLSETLWILYIFINFFNPDFRVNSPDELTFFSPSHVVSDRENNYSWGNSLSGKRHVLRLSEDIF